MRRLILFVEGEGETDAVPVLVKSLLTANGEWYDVLLDDRPFRVGSVDKLVKNDFRDWKRFLGAALKRPNVGGVLLILDGDTEKIGGKAFLRGYGGRRFGRRGEGRWGGTKVFSRGGFCDQGIRNMADRGGRVLSGPTTAGRASHQAQCESARGESRNWSKGREGVAQRYR